MQDNKPNRRRITVLGAGAWGTAVAIAVAARHDVILWGRNADAMRDIGAAHENTHYLPGYPFPPALKVSADFDAAVAHTYRDADGHDGLLIAATPVAGLRPLLESLKGRPIPNLVWLCKGFEYETGLLPHQVFRDVLGEGIANGALSGPSFAQEVAKGLPCALTIASSSAGLRECVVAAVHGGTMRVYSSEDIVGVEVGGAVKNVMAIATGIADGLGLGLNARAALVTRGLAEITRLGTALGGNIETFMGLTGMGDLILTCTGDLSRNRRVGLGLAQGKALATIVTELGHVAEGVPCAKAVRELAGRLGVEMPITNGVAAVLFDGVKPQDLVTRMLARDPRDETLAPASK
ncbi:glycerol-3-phosphate dehydrogenase (NAD(P)+) [Pseudoduganella flava]|uniref:Glycerol-3-phosphate dehydrogenase [NAD(P)+] n=1 Tax=Pseudoduganella flava TaxID=871742 RepID=A0A562PP35_9BURK|nr:NAD(P)H-dependent glycerol-3-phosphate dehydrogenase [Pseudoduganella flava]QGZ40675.1 NAD(P)H-dependent glycerol-3-phosphate dehydrogenase [Pseudoduganella flava]TWI46128.1 glycerol-3-phosphate dehydrogenase (NAD(P)+) [Pseudoduganella flava]